MRRFIRPVFTAPLSLIRVITRSRLDNFVGGVIFGALFSLVVNIVTVKIQEDIQKQRIFESLESEILSNALTAKSVVEENTKILEANSPPNYFSTSRYYSNKVWNNSEALKYIIELEPEIQASLEPYYSYGVNSTNSIINRGEELSRKSLENCYLYWTQ